MPPNLPTCWVLLIIVLLGQTSQVAADDYTTEISLTANLLSGYDKQNRPSNDFTVEVTFFINQIIAIDDSSQQMRSSMNILAEWTDPRLAWSKSTYNIDWALIKADSIWVPDLVILNSASTSIFLSLDSKTLALLYYTGVVAVIYSVPTLTTRCPMNVRKFPFDKQSCPINISSWALCENQYSITIDEVVTDFYTENPVWILDSNNIKTKDQHARDRFTYRNSDCNMEVAALNLQLTRRPLFYMINMMFTTFILTILTLFAYALPSTSQFGISLTIFLNYSVTSVRIASLMPIQSVNMPLVLWYLFGSMMITLSSFVWFVTDYWIRTNACLPAWLATVCVTLRGWLKKVWSKIKGCKCCKCCKCKKRKVDPEKKEDVKDVPNNVTIDVEADGDEDGGGGGGPVQVKNDEDSAPEPGAAETGPTSCIKCEACAKCKAKDEEKKAKDKIKSELDRNMLFLNRVIFLIVLFSSFIFNLSIWCYIGSD